MRAFYGGRVGARRTRGGVRAEPRGREEPEMAERPPRRWDAATRRRAGPCPIMARNADHRGDSMTLPSRRAGLVLPAAFACALTALLALAARRARPALTRPPAPHPFAPPGEPAHYPPERQYDLR